MPPPLPLTATEPAQFDLSRPGTPASGEFGDIYFSVDGGLEESREVFLRGNRLPERWADRDGPFVIGETGFGTGLNVLAAWRMWRGTGARGRLHVVSVERYPLDREQLAAALAAFPELSELTAELMAKWPGRVRGVHRLEFPDLTLDLHFDDIENALDGMEARVDAWFLDGFSPARNARMWSPEVLSRIGELSAPDATLATFTVAGRVRRGLEAAGFSVERVPGFGRKRHRLEARREGASTSKATHIRPVIIGGGIAGASVARALLRGGVRPVVVTSPGHADQAASANPLAMVKPRLDRQDRPESRFFLQSYLHALRAYADDCIRARGVRQVARSAAERERFAAVADQAPLPARHLRATDDGLHFPSALVIDPVAACEAMLDGCERVEAHVDDLSRHEEGWSVSAGGRIVAGGTHVVVATGLDAKTRFPELELRATRGQLSWADTDLDAPVAYGGYALPIGGRTLLGATHDRLDGAPTELRAEDDAENARKLRGALGEEARDLSPARASARVARANTLPWIVEGDGMTVFTALGSRGFTHAPLLGADIASRLLDLPRPLTRDQIRVLSGRLP